MAAGAADTSGMVRLAGGEYAMGSERFYSEERPVRRVRVGPFWIDEASVTNRQFELFVACTNYRTLAETPPDPRNYPGMPTEMAHAGSLLFRKAATQVNLGDSSQWWEFAFGADWRHPAKERRTQAPRFQRPQEP